MKKFITKSLVFFVLITIVFFAITFNFKRSYHLDSDYLASIIDKHQRLDSIKENRLILIGGSNLSFGVDSKMLSDSLNVNTINMGLHAGLGLEFMLNEIKPSIRKNDNLVLYLEYPLYLDDAKVDVDLIAFTQEIYPPAKQFYHFSFKEEFLGYYEKFKKRIDPPELKIDPIFNRKEFNKFGDNIGHLNAPSEKNLKDKKPIGRIEVDKSFALIKDFEKEVLSKGASLFISYVAYPKDQFLKNKKNIAELNTAIKNRLYTIPLINTPESFAFDSSLFFDTVYHLNKEGRDKRTKLFIEELKEYIK
jgi:hypothetical protein